MYQTRDGVLVYVVLMTPPARVFNRIGIYGRDDAALCVDVEQQGLVYVGEMLLLYVLCIQARMV